MSMNLTILVATALSACLLAGATVFLSLAAKCHWNIAGILKKAEKTVANIQNAERTIEPFLPGAALGADRIIRYAAIAVRGAEQLYDAGIICGGLRREKAEEFIEKALETVNIPVTPPIRKLIDLAVEAEVFALGHGKAALSAAERKTGAGQPVENPTLK